MTASVAVEYWTSADPGFPSFMLVFVLMVFEAPIGHAEYCHGAREQRQWAVMERDRLWSFPPAARDQEALARAESSIQKWDAVMAAEAASVRDERTPRSVHPAES